MRTIPGYWLTVAGFSFSSKPDVTFRRVVSSVNMIGAKGEKCAGSPGKHSVNEEEDRGAADCAIMTIENPYQASDATEMSKEARTMAESKRLRAIIVDDEQLGRQKILEMLKNDHSVEVIAECTNGRDAVEAIRSKLPDLLFLDIQMPGLDGFGVLEALDQHHLPAVIFVTAYDQYAVQAFEVHALDYLLKPFDKERFHSALQRAKSYIEQQKQGDARERVLALLEGLRAARRQASRLVVKSGGRVFFLKTEEIDWIEAAGNYVRLHVGNETHLLRETMSAIEKKLDPNQFIRIHRSTFVNMEKIKELQPWFHGEYVVILRDGTQLTMSRSYRNHLPELLGKAL